MSSKDFVPSADTTATDAAAAPAAPATPSASANFPEWTNHFPETEKLADDLIKDAIVSRIYKPGEFVKFDDLTYLMQLILDFIIYVKVFNPNWMTEDDDGNPVNVVDVVSYGTLYQIIKVHIIDHETSIVVKSINTQTERTFNITQGKTKLVYASPPFGQLHVPRATSSLTRATPPVPPIPTVSAATLNAPCCIGTGSR